MSCTFPPLLFPLFLLNLATNAALAAQLRPGFYAETCPEAEVIVRDVIMKAMIREPRNAASVMRLQFHDCFVNVSLTYLTFISSTIFLLFICWVVDSVFEFNQTPSLFASGS